MSIAQITGASTGTQTGMQRTTELDRDAFLQLLVTQMKNQDPLNPMEDKEFVAQLAQFSSLEQLFAVNENLQANSSLAQTTNNSLVASLIGKEVTAAGNKLTIADGGQVEGHFRIDAAADVSVAITDAYGHNIRSLELGQRNPGMQTFLWDGKDNAGKSMAPGEYFFKVSPVAANGQVVDAQELIKGPVRQVRFNNGQAVIIMDGLAISPANIIEIGETEDN